MTAGDNAETSETDRTPPDSAESATPPRLRQFPGLVAISAYMCLLAAVSAYGVSTGHATPFYLVGSLFLVIGAAGLVLFRRWGWALTQAAILLISGFFFWSYATRHSGASLGQGLLNLLFFLYLIRSELREKLR